MDTKDFPIILENKRYDIKQFLRDHPGGVKTLEYYKGKCVRDVMAKFDHSSSAYHILNDFKIDEKEPVQELVDSNLTGSVSENGRIITKEENKRNVEEIQFLEELEVNVC